MTAEPPTPPRDVALTAGAAVACAVLAAWLRAPWLSAAYTGDELANLLDGGLLAQLAEPESGVNPPLLRWLMNLRADGPARLSAGRAIAVEASVLASAAGAVAARLAGGRWWCAALAGLLLAAHPWAVVETATARAYGLTSLVLAVHLASLAAWASRPEDRRGAAAVALTAVALPWCHYVTVPWLLLVGLGVAATVPALRRLPLLYAPAALGFLPLAERILGATSRREPPQRSAAEVLDMALGLGLQNGRYQLAAGTPALPDNPSLATALVGLTLLGAALAWRRLPGRLRVAWWAAVALPMAAVGLNAVQYVRASTAVLATVAAAPLLGALPAALPRWWQRAALSLALVGGLTAPAVAIHERLGPDPHREAVRELARQVAAGGWPPGEGAVVVHPQAEAVVFLFYLSGLHVSRAAEDPRCQRRGDCMVALERTWLPRSVLSDEARWGVSFARYQRPPEGCEPAEGPPGAVVWRCPTDR